MGYMEHDTPEPRSAAANEPRPRTTGRGSSTTCCRLRFVESHAGNSRDTLNRHMMWRDTANRQSPVVRIPDASPANGVFLLFKRLLAAPVLLVMVSAAAVHAQGLEGQRSVTLFVGTGLSLAGNAINE